MNFPVFPSSLFSSCVFSDERMLPAIYRVVQKKLHKVYCVLMLQPFAVESHGFHRNTQKRSLFTSPCKICYQLVKYSLRNSRNWIHVMSDVTLHVNMMPLTVEDRLLIDFANWKRLSCWNITVEFSARQWKCQILLFDFVRIIESAGFAKSLSDRPSDQRC